ncbi:MAG: DUF452 family protein [Lachnoclostridium sp.]|nr:DUF452 family protein [Lachnoclostridium sp.]
MKYRYIVKEDNPGIILLFAGWSMDDNPFRELKINGYDLMVIWDYRDIEFPKADMSDYGEVIVAAWSFGVPAAALLIASGRLPISATIAINGTQHPVDDTLGIPKDIFNATLNNLSEENLTKFYRRMTGSRDRFSHFMLHHPERDIDELRDELRAIASRKNRVVKWDIAIISEGDRIIPPINQHNTWASEAIEIISIDDAHIPDLQSILSSILTDKSLVASRFAKVMDSYDTNASVQLHAAERLINLWNPSADSSFDIIEIGCGTGYATRQYLSMITPRSLQLWDLTIAPGLPEAAKLQCDAEAQIAKTPHESADIIFSTSTIQWFNSLPSFFKNAACALRPGGKLIISTYGNLNFHQLNCGAEVTHCYPGKDALLTMLPESLKAETVEDEQIDMVFDTPADALRHIRLTGVNALSRSTSPSITRSILSNYPRHEDGKYHLTYHPIYLIIRKL